MPHNLLFLQAKIPLMPIEFSWRLGRVCVKGAWPPGLKGVKGGYHLAQTGGHGGDRS